MSSHRGLTDISLAVVGRAYPNEDGSNRGFETLLCKPGDPIELRPEPKNKRDPRAVAVFSERNVQIGYLTAERCGWIGSIIRSGQNIRAIFQAQADFGAWIRVSFDGTVPVIPAQPAIMPVEPNDGWFPDEIWPDDDDEWSHYG